MYLLVYMELSEQRVYKTFILQGLCGFNGMC